MIYRDKEDLINEDGSINVTTLEDCIEEHKKSISRLKDLANYYDMPLTHKLNVNHAKEIVDLATSYVFGKPVSYTDGHIEGLVDWFSEIDEDSHNYEMGKAQSIFGKAYELIYMDSLDEDDKKTMPFLIDLSPMDAFIVKDTGVRHKTILGCYYTVKLNTNGQIEKYNVIAYTKDDIMTYQGTDLTCLNLQTTEQHYFKAVPLLELDNNKEEKGDFEDVIGLIDAYNDLQANRVKDKKQFVDRLLVLINSSLGDNEEDRQKNIDILKNGGVLELESEDERQSTAQFLSQQLNESEVEVLKKSLSQDIHKIAKVPDLTDQNFAGDSSGIALQYKLFGTEQLGNQKERQFKKLLRERLRLINNALSIKNMNVDVSKVSVTMKRNLPVSLDEKLQELQGTEGSLSLETRLHRFDEDLNVEEEISRLHKEQEEKDKNMSNAFNNYLFTDNQDKDNPDENINEKDTKDINSDEKTNLNTEQNRQVVGKKKLKSYRKGNR